MNSEIQELNPELAALVNEAQQLDAEHLPEPAAINPDGSENVTSASNVTPEMALAEASLAVNLIADGATALYPVLQYGPVTRQTAADKLAPLLAKYNLSSDLFGRWKEEIDAGVFFATLIYQSYAKVKAARAEEEKAQAAQSQAGPVASIYPESI